MVQPPRPWPKPPPRNHAAFEPTAMAAEITSDDQIKYFFCNGLPLKSPAYKIMAAVVREDHATLRKLLDDPVNLPDFGNANGVSPLMVAAARNNLTALHLLADHPLVNLARTTTDGWTALHYAAFAEKPESAAVLLKRHAPFTVENLAGETPFELAQGKDTANAFWQHKPFVYDMKQRAPEHPTFQSAAPRDVEKQPPAPLPAVEPEAPVTFPALGPLFNAMAGSIADEGRRALQKQIINNMPRMGTPAFIDLYHQINAHVTPAKGDDAPLDWERIFVAAAASGNAGVLMFLARQLPIEQDALLNLALDTTIQNGDHPHIAHLLLRWGADANSKSGSMRTGDGKPASLIAAAFTQRRFDTFAACCLWTDKIKDASFIPFVKTAVGLSQEGILDKSLYPRDQATKIDFGLQLHARREALRSMSGHKLDNAFDTAVHRGDLPMILAGFAESFESPLFRGPVRFSEANGGNAIARAIQHAQFDVARLMIGAGYHIRHARQDLRDLVAASPDIERKAFLAAHEAGTLQVSAVFSIEEKFRMLQSQAMRGPMSGRAYGM